MTCPHCGSSNLAYAEDVTTTYVIREIKATVKIEPEGAVSDEPVNERLICTDCNEEIELPDGMDVEIVEAFGAPVADPDEPRGSES